MYGRICVVIYLLNALDLDACLMYVAEPFFAFDYLPPASNSSRRLPRVFYRFAILLFIFLPLIQF